MRTVHFYILFRHVFYAHECNVQVLINDTVTGISRRTVHVTSVLSFQLKSFHNELLSELEKKVELDARYLTVSV